MLQYLIMAGLYSTGVVIAFFLLPYLRPKPMDEEYGIQLDNQYDRLFVEFSLADEVEEAPDSCLTEEELRALRDKILRYEIPHVKLQVILFYDHEKQAFCYYSPSSIIHKYLNVAARKYVLEYGCKQLYKEMTPCVKRVEEHASQGPFVSKPSQQFMEKEINKYLYLGNLYEFQPEIKQITKKVSFAEYLRLQADADSCTPETQSTKLD